MIEGSALKKSKQIVEAHDASMEDKDTIFVR